MPKQQTVVTQAVSFAALVGTFTVLRRGLADWTSWPTPAIFGAAFVSAVVASASVEALSRALFRSSNRATEGDAQP